MKLEHVLKKLSQGEYTNAQELDSLLRLKKELESVLVEVETAPKKPKKKVINKKIKGEGTLKDNFELPSIIDDPENEI